MGLTQDQLAERVGRTVEMVNRIERGVAAPSFETLEALSAALETAPRDFFGLGQYEARAGGDRGLERLLDRVAGLDPDDVDWIDRLVALALARKVRRPL
jgi:transcriptional regulator with XRE-family HTH domain